ncbi:MAG: hypothetical protein AB7N53_14505 [Candidatus Binatia bacterium]
MRLISALRVCYAALVAVAVGTCTAGGSAADSERDVVSQLDVHIHTVVAGGHWCRGEDEGFYRVVVYTSGLEEVYHHLYVQLLKIDPERHDVLVDRSLPVKEAQGLDLVFSNLTLTTASSEPCADALVEATVSRRTIDGHRPERFRMRVTSAGNYEVRFEAR